MTYQIDELNIAEITSEKVIVSSKVGERIKVMLHSNSGVITLYLTEGQILSMCPLKFGQSEEFLETFISRMSDEEILAEFRPKKRRPHILMHLVAVYPEKFEHLIETVLSKRHLYREEVVNSFEEYMQVKNV